METKDESSTKHDERAKSINVINTAMPTLSDAQLMVLGMVAIEMQKLAMYQGIVAKMTEVK